jgi:hypothetical protein
MTARTLNLKKFNPREMERSSISVVIGARNSGKTVTTVDVIEKHKDISQVIAVCGSIGSKKAFKGIVPPLFVYDQFHTSILARVTDAQEEADEDENRQLEPILLLIDDCMYDDKIFKTTEMKRLFFNGRHVKIMTIITMQDPLGVPRPLRGNIDYVFIMNEDKKMNLKRLYENYAGVFDSEREFNKVLSKVTTNYRCLVIKNNVRSENLEDKVFWYKSNFNIPPFRIGSKKQWEISNKIYNEEFIKQRRIAARNTSLGISPQRIMPSVKLNDEDDEE